MCDPFVIASSSRRNETSCGASPGAVCDEERICEIRIGRPVSVARTSRWMRYLEPVNFSGAGAGAVVILTLSCRKRLGETRKREISKSDTYAFVMPRHSQQCCRASNKSLFWQERRGVL